MIIFTTIGSFFITIQQTVFVLFIINELKLTSLQFGLVVSSSGVASLIGALLVSRIAHRIGPGPTIILGQGFTGLGGVLLTVAGGATGPGALSPRQWTNRFRSGNATLQRQSNRTPPGHDARTPARSRQCE